MVAREIYDPDAQTWLDHGYAYLTINYRGSTTFGREFKEKIWGDLGHWEVEDMVAARDWLIHEGIAQPNAILVTGASYGGYLIEGEDTSGKMGILFSQIDFSPTWRRETDQRGAEHAHSHR